MTDELRTFLKEKAGDLAAASSACAEAKAAANRFLAALGTAEEAAAATALVREAEEDIEPIDGLVAFAHSDAAAGIFGAEGAKAFAAHADALAASGAEYCDCPACTACAAILSRKADLLG